MIRAAFQIDEGEPQVFEGDGLILSTVTRTGGGNLSVTPCVQCLTYDEVARALMATQVSIWQEFVGQKGEATTLKRDIGDADEFWPAYPYKCGSCGKTFFGGISGDHYGERETTLGFCPICGAKVKEIVDVEGGL